MVGLPADKNWAENVYMPWPNFHPSFSESIFLLLAPYSVDLLQIGQRPCRLYPLAQSSSLFWSALPVTGTPSFSLLASPFPAAPGVHPAAPPRTSLPPAHRAPGKDTIHREPPPLKVAEGQGKWGKAPFFSLHHIWLYKSWCAANQPVTDFFSVSSDLSSWGSPWFSGWSWTVSSLGVSVSWVITYSSLGEWAGLAELRLKQMVGTGRNECACMLPNEQQ